jgi:hypothetical protein
LHLHKPRRGHERDIALACELASLVRFDYGRNAVALHGSFHREYDGRRLSVCPKAPVRRYSGCASR